MELSERNLSEMLTPPPLASLETFIWKRRNDSRGSNEVIRWPVHEADLKRWWTHRCLAAEANLKAFISTNLSEEEEEVGKGGVE